MAAAPAGIDELERAVVCAFPSPDAAGAAAATPEAQQLRRQAAAYLDQFKALPNAWTTAWQLLFRTTRDVVKFWCLQVIEAFVNSPEYEKVPLPQRGELRGAMLAWVKGNCAPLPAFLKNWVALVLVRLVRADYPEYWPAAFDDVFALAASGAAHIDFILRFLRAVDEQVVARTPAFDKDMHRRNTAIKDAMRHTVNGKLCHLIHTVVVTFKTSNEELAESALMTLEKYVSWIDIGLVANDTFVPLLCELLAHEGLRIPAIVCFREMVLKGMARLAKVQLIKQLRLVDLLCALRVSPDVDSEFLAVCAELASLVGVELLAAWQKAVEGKAEAEMPTLVPPLLTPLAGRAFVFMVHPDVTVGKKVVPFAKELVGGIKDELRAMKAGTVPAQLARTGFSLRPFAKQLIECLATRMRYPAGDLSPPDELEFADARRLVKQEFVNLARHAPEQVLEFFRDHIVPKIAALATLGWQDIELAMHMLFHYAEAGGPDISEAMKSGPLANMILAVHRSGVGVHPNRLVMLAYLDLTVRYATVLHCNAELLLPVLRGMLGAGGLKHAVKQVRLHSAYQVSRLVKTFVRAKSLAAPLLDPIVAGVQEFLVIPYPGTDTEAQLPADQQRFLFETVGLLLAAPWMAPETTTRYLQASLAPLLERLEQGLKHVASGSMSPEAAVAMGDWLTRVLGSVGLLIKGFKSEVPESVAAVVQVVLEAAVKAGHALPTHPKLRHKVMFLLHRGVICLGERLLPALGTVITALVETMAISSVADVGRLLHQLAAKHHVKAAPVLDQVFMPFVKRVFELMPAPDHTPQSATSLERAEMQQSYLSFLHSCLVNGCAGVMVSQRNAGSLPTVLNTLVQAAQDTFSVGVVKSVFTVLRAMVAQWVPEPGTAPNAASGAATAAPVFLRFVWDTASRASFSVCASPRFDFDDAASSITCVEILTFLAMMLTRCVAAEANFGTHLLGTVLPSLGVPPDAATEFCRLMAECLDMPRRMRRPFQMLCLRMRELVAARGSPGKGLA